MSRPKAHRTFHREICLFGHFFQGSLPLSQEPVRFGDLQEDHRLEHGFGNPGSPKDDIGSYEWLGKFKGKSLNAEKLVSTLPRVVCRAEF